jgi:hypothetical protein
MLGLWADKYLLGDAIHVNKLDIFRKLTKSEKLIPDTWPRSGS